MENLILIWPVVVFILVILFVSINVIKQYENWVVFTLGKFTRLATPGLTVVIPFLQTVTKVDMREKAVDVPAQEVITKDNVSLHVNAVIYYRIEWADKSIINVRNLDYAIMQFAQTTMRNVIWWLELDELLSKMDQVWAKIQELVDHKVETRWINIWAVELKDVSIPDDLKRTIGKQAEAEREKRAKIIDAEWELAASQKLSEAAAILASVPGALHLRTLQSINDISSDQSNTTVWMVPLEVLRAVEAIWTAMKK